jgi:hypothetical protein
MGLAPTSEVVRQITVAGYLECCIGLTTGDCCLHFQLSNAGYERLANDKRFVSGLFYGLHRDVGPHLKDYRSHTGSFGRGSLQITFSETTGQAYADVDRWSPYSDVVGFVGHAGEVIGGSGWFKKVFRRGKKEGMEEAMGKAIETALEKKDGE